MHDLRLDTSWLDIPGAFKTLWTTLGNKLLLKDQTYFRCEAYACALVLSGRRAKKPIHDGSQKNELNGYRELIVSILYKLEKFFPS
jgi:hypothetical protein